ncbi:adenine deaminase [Carboxydochorda subterranea]|uniref:Adenine deaminase n=1 Tax=Carboxydichorda subterranea TaxID=3109565 RepID=A0ABZ1BTX1_9FIRM|nr:adenine deaminase [Limnochorda sp. L945t]WRP16262.1 adenine deaminase [Limnochorda sp. L945t]
MAGKAGWTTPEGPAAPSGSPGGPLAPEEVRKAVAVAAGREAGSVMLRGVDVVNVFTGEILPGPVVFAGRLIAATGEQAARSQAREVVELPGGLVVPGFVDGHVHLESALVEPREYARAVVPRGVTAVVWDPHEWANVVGKVAFEAASASTRGLPLDVFLTASSSVPASPLETAGACLGAGDLDEALAMDGVVGLAELMNFPGVAAGDEQELRKIWMAERRGKVTDGHAPLLGGRALSAYVAAGVASDHESVSLEEAREKLRLGMMVFIREGSAARNLADLLPLVTPRTKDRFCLVTDDRHPHDLVREGGVDHAVRKAVALGLDLPTAVQMATLNPCRYFGLRRRGAVAPGYRADVVVLDPVDLSARAVFKDGRMVAAHGRLLVEVDAPTDPRLLHTVHLPPLSLERIRLPRVEAGAVRAIGLLPGQIVTRALAVEPPVVDAQVVAAPEQDLVKLVVIERHGRSGGIGVGLLQGLGLKRGALASTVAHDAHNLIVAGVSDDDILAAARAVARSGGGFAAVEGGRVLAELPLPVAGLMSQRPLPEVVEALDRLELAARNLGVQLAAPFMALSFMALSVIPELKLTDRGLVDASAGQVVSWAAGPAARG